MLYLDEPKKRETIRLRSQRGRRYEGHRHTGAGVSELVLPRPDSEASMHGYSNVPGLVTVSPSSPIVPSPQSPPPTIKNL